MHLKFVLVCLFFLSPNVFASEWDITPKLFSRGGITQSLDLDAKGNSVNNFNPGSWTEESNAFMKNLTELDMVANYKDQATIVYGVSVSENENFEKSGGATNFKERQTYIEMYNALGDGSTLWFGRRPYRGFGDSLTGSFPLDERNMFGGGIKVKAGPGNYEFAYGTNDDDDVDTTDGITDNFTTNFFLNKYILPITDGNITINGEIHQNNAKNPDYESYGYMLGGQYARWNMKLINANWYNIFLLNYSNGHTGDIDAGTMLSAFDSKHKDERASKILAKVSGELKSSSWGMLYNFRYQWHLGNLRDNSDKIVDGQDWQFLDVMIRPMYALTDNVGVGIDYVQRIIVKEVKASTASSIDKTWIPKQNMWRGGLMLNYHLHQGVENLFENSEVSVIAGRIHKQNETSFFQGRENKKNANFIRFKYTIQF